MLLFYKFFIIDFCYLYFYLFFILESCKPLSMDVSPEDFEEKLKIILRVAQFYQFFWLEQTILELLN